MDMKMLPTPQLNNPLNTHNICRCCLTEDAELQSIFIGTNDTLKSLKHNEMLMNFSTVKIIENDGLPSNICNACIRQTCLAYSFKQQVETSEELLRNHLNQSNDFLKSNIKDEFGSICSHRVERKTNLRIHESSLLNDNIKSDSDFENERNVDCSQPGKRQEKNKKKNKRPKGHKSIKMLSKIGSETQCQICEKPFSDPISLKEHIISSIVIDVMDTSTKEQEVSSNLCSECNIKFETSAEFTLHKNTIHPEDTENKKDIQTGKSIFNMLNVATPSIRNSKRLQERPGNSINTKMKSRQEFKVFKCPICSSEIISQNEGHINLHEGLGDSTCVYCLEKLKDNSELVAHVKHKHNPTKPFPCKLCNSSFISDGSLQVHTRIKHTKERTLLCPICPKRYIEVRDLNRHKIAHQKKFSCHICSKTFSLKSTLKIHVPKHFRVGNRTCQQCGQILTDDFQLERHIKVMHSGESHECPHCSKVFSHISRLTKHQLSHNSEDERRLKCRHCPKRFNYRHHLRNHERTHTGAKPFLCSKCGRGFSQSHNLTVHQRQHEEVQPYPCKLCDKTFAQPQRLRRHIMTHTGEKPFMCNLCGKCFCDNATLKRHIKLHEDIPEDREEFAGLKIEMDSTDTTKPLPEAKRKINSTKNKIKSNGSRHVCTICSETFSDRTRLTVHKRKHSCKYVCEICNRKFALPSILEAHRKSHPAGQSLRQYACSECGLTFRRQEHLRAHARRSHSYERPYSCPHCPAKYCQSGELTVHMRKHTGEKPYVCTFCNKAFAASTSLTIHIRTHTGEKPYPCKICSRSFSTSTGLFSHTKTHNSRFKGDTGVKNYLTSDLYQDDIEKKLSAQLINKPDSEALKIMPENIRSSSEDAFRENKPEGRRLQKKIYLLNENNEVTVMETVDNYSEVSNQYIDSENENDDQDIYLSDANNDIKYHGNHMPDIDNADYLNAPSISNNSGMLDPNFNLRTKNNRMTGFNILRSIDGKITLHLPGNVSLNDGDSLKIDMANNIEIVRETRAIQNGEPLELAEDSVVENTDDVVCDENVGEEVDAKSDADFELVKYANEGNQLHSKELHTANLSIKGRKNRVEQKGIRFKAETKKDTVRYPSGSASSTTNQAYSSRSRQKINPSKDIN